MANKIVTCRCSLEFFTSKDDTLCSRCRQESQPTTYGLRFYGGVAEPTQAFWKAWRQNPDAVKRERFFPTKQGSGRWIIKRPEMGEKTRVNAAIKRRYASFASYARRQ